MKRIELFILTALYAFTLSGQEIILYFPHFAGQEYDFYLFEGNKNDTIQSGIIPEDGRLTINARSYTGMGRWLLRSGGGLDFVVNKENFSVSCIEATPNQDNIIYKGSEENDFLLENFFSQQVIFQKLDAIHAGIEAYAKEPDNPVYSLLFSELEKQEKAFMGLTEATTASPLYAARFRRISSFLNGWPMYTLNHYKLDEQLKDHRRFVENELSMDILFTSGFWREVIAQCLELYKDEDIFMQTMITKLEQTGLQTAYTQLAEELINICERYGWEKQEEQLIYFLNNNARISKPTGKLKQVMTLSKLTKGSAAPKLASSKGVLDKFSATILVFYETGCGNCDSEMQELKKHYKQLKEMNCRIVSISSDTDERIFRNTSEQFPWKEKYCDLLGFDGEDFKNYGVIGTPTIFIIDRDGIILGRYARIKFAIEHLNSFLP